MMGVSMELHDAILRRRTTNGPFLPDPVRPEHQRRIIEAASRAPSHFNSQPWRFVLIDDPDRIGRIASLADESMTRLIEDGLFFERYKRYFRFSRAEMDERRDGIFIDHLPAPLRPFIQKVFSETGLKVMRTLGVPERLGKDNQKLVAGSPLLLAVMLDREEYVPDKLSGFYSLFGMGAAMENIWLTVGDLGMGIQFVSTPMEVPSCWQEIQDLLEVPPDLALMAIYRLGYLPPENRRPTIDWTSNERKPYDRFVFRNTCRQPEPLA